MLFSSRYDLNTAFDHPRTWGLLKYSMRFIIQVILYLGHVKCLRVRPITWWKYGLTVFCLNILLDISSGRFSQLQ